jgi:outer membrane protein assembly factor BamB
MAQIPRCPKKSRKLIYCHPKKWREVIMIIQKNILLVCTLFSTSLVFVGCSWLSGNSSEVQHVPRISIRKVFEFPPTLGYINYMEIAAGADGFAYAYAADSDEQVCVAYVSRVGWQEVWHHTFPKGERHWPIRGLLVTNDSVICLTSHGIYTFDLGGTLRNAQLCSEGYDSPSTRRAVAAKIGERSTILYGGWMGISEIKADGKASVLFADWVVRDGPFIYNSMLYYLIDLNGGQIVRVRLPNYSRETFSVQEEDEEIKGLGITKSGTVVVSTASKEVVAYSAERKRLWAVHLEAKIGYITPTSNGGVLVNTWEGTLVCISANGEIMWQKKICGDKISIYKPILLEPDLILAACESGGMMLLAADGTVVLNTSLGIIADPVVVSPRSALVAGKDGVYELITLEQGAR